MENQTRDEESKDDSSNNKTDVDADLTTPDEDESLQKPKEEVKDIVRQGNSEDIHTEEDVKEDTGSGNREPGESIQPEVLPEVQEDGLILPETIYERQSELSASINTGDQHVDSSDSSQSSAIFSLAEWDNIADIPTIHFSFLLRTILPKTQTSLTSEIWQRDQENFTKEFTGKSVKMVGSSAEGYKIPNMLNRGSFHSFTKVEAAADTDVLMVWDITPFSEYDPNSLKKQKIILDTSKTFPGYSRIFINDPETVLRGVDPDYAIEFESKLYLNAKKQRNDINKIVGDEVKGTRYQVDMKGPATGLDDLIERTLKLFQSSIDKKMLYRQEMVPALPCKWPSIANEWITRTRDNDWLNQSVIETIVAEGCHVVPVSHKFSVYPDVEWRISFATSEVKIARTIVTEEQRHCYICLKILRKQMLTHVEKQGQNYLTSYQCKTAFLYSCEKLPVSVWKQNTASCFLYMVDALLECFRKKCLPSYFIPENNLIGHFSEEEMKSTESILLAARYDPIGPLLAFSDTRIMAGHGTTSPFRKSIDCILKDFDAFRVHRSVKISFIAFFQAQFGLMSSLLLDNNIDVAVVNLFDIFQFYEMYFPEQDIESFISMSLLKWKPIMQLVQVYEKLIHHVQQYPSMKTFRGYLACLYHTASMNFTPGTRKHTEATQKAEQWFNVVLDDMGIKTPTTVDYAIFLLNTGKHDKAKKILKSLLTSTKLDEPLLVNKYTHITLSTLECQLRNELQGVVKSTLVITLPTISLAHYIFLKCQCKCNCKFEDELEEFQQHCRKQSDGWSYYLLGLFCLSVENFNTAHASFVASNDLNPSLSIARIKIHTSKVQHMIKVGEEKDAVMYLLEVASREGKDMPLAGFLDWLIIGLDKSSYAIKLYEKIMDLAEEKPELLSLRGNMSCMYHASAYEYKEGTDERLLALAQADTLFATFTSTLNDMKIASVVDYALFLLAQERWADGEAILRTIVPARLASLSKNSYGPIEYNTLDANLKQEVDIHGIFEVESSTLAFYCLAKCVFNIHSAGVEFNKVISDFENHCNNKEDSRAFALLGYCYIWKSWWVEAEDCFCKAVEVAWDYTAAKRNMMDCRIQAEALGFPKRKLEEIYVPLCIIPDLAGDYTLDYDKLTAI